MLAKKLLLASISVMCINTSIYGEEWKRVKCMAECTNASCADAAKKDICQTNCASNLGSIDACMKAQPQGSSQGTKPTSPPRRALPPQPQPSPVQPEKSGGEQDQPEIARAQSSKRQAMRFSKPPLESAGTKHLHSHKSLESSAREKIGTTKEAGEDVPQKTKLLEAQIDMLKEAVMQAEVCYQMGRDVAKEAAKDPVKFEEDIKSEERGKDAIFPNVYVSIFDKNPNFVTETLEPTKMDQQSFVFHLKEQRKTIGVNLADMLKEILNWEDASKIEKYKKSISGDLRALSSFCNAPTVMLRQAIKYKQEHPTAKAPEKKPNIFRQAKNKITGTQN